MDRAITIRLTDYGAVPDSGADATGPMKLALSAVAGAGGPVVLECPRGRYDFYPDEAIKVDYYVSNTASEEERADVSKTIGIYMKGSVKPSRNAADAREAGSGRLPDRRRDRERDMDAGGGNPGQRLLEDPDARSWFESGMATDVDIRDNVFEACGGPGHPVVRIEPENETMDADADRLCVRMDAMDRDEALGWTGTEIGLTGE